jgi:DNA (cytosine-5)-methyltransferase 1
MSEKIKAVSLFSGCGGSDLGLVGGFSFLGKHYNSCGIEIIHASDIDKKAVITYNENFTKKAVAEDIRNIDFGGILADIVIGGFPCQNFSTVNPNKRPHERKNQLFWEMNRVVGEIKPAVFVAENVKGFYRLKNGHYFETAKKVFEEKGYRVYYQLMNAASYGVPQLRERIIMVGIRNDVKGDFVFPEATHGVEGKPDFVPLKEVIDSVIPENEKYYFSSRAVDGVKKAKPNMKRALAQNLEKPCLTVTSHLAKVSLNSRDPVILVDSGKELYRRFTPREVASIQSFPDEFALTGSEGDAYRQLGNAVPPVLMWHITKEIIRQFFS